MAAFFDNIAETNKQQLERRRVKQLQTTVMKLNDRTLLCLVATCILLIDSEVLGVIRVRPIYRDDSDDGSSQQERIDRQKYCIFYLFVVSKCNECPRAA